MIEKKKTLDSINDIKDHIQEIWNEISTNDVSHLKEIWNDKACEEFTKKIDNISNTMNDIMVQLNLLETFWEQYKPNNFNS